MFQEIFIAILKAGLPVGLASFALTWWAIKKNYLGEISTIKDLEAGIKKQKKDKKDKKDKKNGGRTSRREICCTTSGWPLAGGSTASWAY